MGFAKHAAQKSKDLSTKVGCVIVGHSSEIVSTGYNGIPRGVKDAPERMGRPQKYLWTSHAEENAIAHAARVGVSLLGCALYVTHTPCSRCARLLIQAGISRIFVGTGSMEMQKSDPDDFYVASTMFEEAGVEVQKGV